jgi:SPP1 family predicted phage head-tail adaptor
MTTKEGAEMYVNAGELNKRIQIIARVESLDSAGYPTITERIVRSCWAKFSQTSGTEMVRANADFGEVKTRFLVRWTSTPVDRKMLVRFRGEDYEIQYINDYGGSREYLELWCRWLSREE